MRDNNHTHSILYIIDQFDFSGNITEIIPWGNGLINDTFRIKTDADGDYLLQRINRDVYSDIAGMMNNVFSITEMIRKKVFYYEKKYAIKPSMYVIPLKNKNIYYEDGDGFGWRAYNFLDHTYSIEKAENEEDVYKAGLILGQFHYLLTDYKVSNLKTVIPNFHNPVHHYKNLCIAIKNNYADRLHEVGDEIAFFKENVPLYDFFNQALISDRIPIRVNHNDPKINNIMFDSETREPLCMVDLDTVMPGLIPYDFGDAIRSCMCTGKDHGPDTDVSSITFDMNFYEAYRNGFLDGIQGNMSEEELEDLPMGAKLIALESGMRYLTDYLNGDKYYKVKYKEQNLVKCRMHIQLYKDMITKI